MKLGRNGLICDTRCKIKRNLAQDKPSIRKTLKEAGNRMKRRSSIKVVTWYMIAAMFILGMVPQAEAGFISSQAFSGASNRADDLNKIQKSLESKMVSETLGKLGLTREEVQLRLSAMTDEQIHQLATNMDEVRVGGDGIGVVIGLLVIAILVVVLLQLTGHRVIVK